ncbi:MAG: hypothetical protein ACREF8_06060 [Chthoniobacterales bacterium]
MLAGRVELRARFRARVSLDLLLFYSVMVHSYALSDEYTALEAPNILSQQQEYADGEMARLRRERGKDIERKRHRQN